MIAKKKMKNYRQMYLVNLDTEIINKISENSNQLCIKIIIQHDQVRFMPCMQDWFDIYKNNQCNPPYQQPTKEISYDHVNEDGIFKSILLKSNMHS